MIMIKIMKNIHIIPTQNNKSKLAIYHYEGSKNIRVGEIGLQVNNNIGWTHCWSERELYITSEEEIKEGDWCLDTLNLILFVSDGRVNVHQNTDKKIILTTDPRLINDKVQAISDEFLEWFVKNPSCEEIEVESFCKNGDNCSSKGAYDKQHLCDVGYKIIIPKEEPKQELNCPFDLTLEEWFEQFKKKWYERSFYIRFKFSKRTKY